MAHIRETLLFICLLFAAAITHGEAYSKISDSASTPWYCHRLVPEFITSSVTPCTYPCLLLSPYEHPRIVVHPEQDGTPCRIATIMDHRFKVGKCRGSVCRATSPYDPLKRKKRFICLYSFVKLMIAKKKLRQLKEIIKKLEHQVASTSSDAMNPLAGGGIGANGISSAGSAAGGGFNVDHRGNDLLTDALGGSGHSGSPVAGGLGSSAGGIPVIGNSGTGGGSGFSSLLESPSSVSTATGGRNPGTGRATTRTSPGISSIANGNTGGGRGTGLNIGRSSPSINNFGTTGLDGRMAGNAGPESVDNSRFSVGSSSASVGNGGSALGGSGIGSNNIGPSALDLSAGSTAAIATGGDSRSDNGVSSISVNGASSANSHTGIDRSRLVGVNMGVILPTMSTTGGGLNGAESTSNTEEFPSGLGENNVNEMNAGSRSGTNFLNSNLEETHGDSVSSGSSAVSAIVRSSNGGVSTDSRSGHRDSANSFSRP